MNAGWTSPCPSLGTINIHAFTHGVIKRDQYTQWHVCGNLEETRECGGTPGRQAAMLLSAVLRCMLHRFNNKCSENKVNETDFLFLAYNYLLYKALKLGDSSKSMSRGCVTVNHYTDTQSCKNTISSHFERC